MKKVSFLALLYLLVGFLTGCFFWRLQDHQDLHAPGEAEVNSQSISYSSIADDEDNKGEEITPTTAYNTESLEEIEELLMYQNGYSYILTDKAAEIFGHRLINLPEELGQDFETTGNYFADTNIEEGQTSVGQYWINVETKKIVMIREFIPSEDTKATFKDHLKLSLDNEDNPLYQHPIELSKDVYGLMWGPNYELLDGSPFEPGWIKSMIHAYWIKDDIGISITGINMGKDEFIGIMKKVNSSIQH